MKPYMCLAICMAFAGIVCAAVGQQNGKTPKLTAAQIQAAIQKGSEYKSPDKFFSKGLLGRRIDPTVYTTVTFFNDWQAIALESAEAKFEMRALKAEDVHPAGLLHAYLETKLTYGTVHWRGVADADAFLRRSNLVLMIDDNPTQSVARRTVSNQGSTVVLAFDFDVSPKDLLNPVTVICIDGDDGRKHHKKADLAGILDPDWNSRR